MKKFLYHVSIGDRHSDCTNVQQVVHFANSVIGCNLITDNTVYNLFCRPDKVNKQILGQLVQISRTEVKLASSSSQV